VSRSLLPLCCTLDLLSFCRGIDEFEIDPACSVGGGDLGQGGRGREVEAWKGREEEYGRAAEDGREAGEEDDFVGENHGQAEQGKGSRRRAELKVPFDPGTGSGCRLEGGGGE
jgi:hypothetical protein